MKKIKYIFCLIILMIFSYDYAFAQNQYGKRIEKVINAPDSTTLARRDSLHRADSLHRRDSVELLSKSSLEMPAFSSARDSIKEDFSNGQRKIFYYGDVNVKYQDMELSAEYMEYDMNTGVVYAKGVLDTLSGEWKGRPVMKQGSKTYNMEEVKYNFNSRKARITNMLTHEEDAILHGQNIKMMEDNSINMTDGRYTVCDHEDPHYYLHLTSAKIVNGENGKKKTIFGPAYLVVEDVKLPFIGLPFGFIPKRPERATGILMPSFGEEEARGFYFRDLGMYFVFGDYFDLSVTGDYYTLGSWAIDVNSRYKVNYKFNGNFSINYSNDQTGEKGMPDFNQRTNFGLKWSHTQDSKAHPGQTFSASINFSSPSNNRYNARGLEEALQNQVSSSVSFSKRLGDKVNLSINVLHSQNSRDSSYTFTLPNISLSMSTIYPFKQKHRVGKEKFYEKFSIGYNMSLQNKIGFKASEFEMSPKFFGKFKNGMSHNFSIGLPNFQLFNYINVNPGVSYSQNWFFQKKEQVYNPETDKVEQVDAGQFNTLGITQNYSFSLSASTRLYGMFNFGKSGKLQAIRHVISPSLSLSASPEKGTYANGYRTLNYTDKNGVEKEYEYNIYAGQLNSPPGKGKSATASLSIGNNIEAKVRDYADTTGTGTKKIKLIDQLTINTSYNFLADSLKMSNINMSMSTSLFDKVRISASASFIPYAIDNQGRTIKNFAVTMGQGLLRFNTMNASASYSISGKGTIKGNDGTKDNSSSAAASKSGNVSASEYYQRRYYHPVTGEFIPDGWLYYTNPNVPWSLNFNASFSLRKQNNYDRTTEKLVSKNVITATLNASGNIKLTPRLSLNASSGFDFVAKKLSSTQISATYDLHCFNIAVSWIPVGTYKSYSFKIAANAAALADILKYKKSSSYWDNGF